MFNLIHLLPLMYQNLWFHRKLSPGTIVALVFAPACQAAADVGVGVGRAWAGLRWRPGLCGAPTGLWVKWAVVAAWRLRRRGEATCADRRRRLHRAFPLCTRPRKKGFAESATQYPNQQQSRFRKRGGDRASTGKFPRASAAFIASTGKFQRFNIFVCGGKLRPCVSERPCVVHAITMHYKRKPCRMRR
jgi:hypothetical protein